MFMLNCDLGKKKQNKTTLESNKKTTTISTANQSNY